MTLTIEKIRDAIGGIVDPDLGKSLKELNAITNVTIDNDLIKIYIELVQPILWVAEKLNGIIAGMVTELAPSMKIEILFSEKPSKALPRNVLPKVKNIIAVASGKGGVGKSAVAANIAASLSLGGAKVGILDGDVYGPSQPTMFGLIGEPFNVQETAEGATVAYPLEKYGIKIASMGFMLSRDEAAIVRGPMLAGYFSMLFEQLEWGELDFLIFDLPPGTGDIQLTMTQKIPLTGAVIVTTPQEISVSDVRRSISMFNRVNVDILGIVENMSYFVPPDMPDKKYYIFGKGGGKNVAVENNIYFLGEIPLDINMRETNDAGKPLVLSSETSNQARVIMNITSELVAQIRKHNLELSQEPGFKISI